MKVPATRIRIYPAQEPGHPQAGKFLQLECDGVNWLLFATPETCRFHNQLLARFLADEGIGFHWIDEETLAAPADRVRVTGGGRFHLDLVANTLELWDNSRAYGRFDERQLVARMSRADPPWNGLNLSIR